MSNGYASMRLKCGCLVILVVLGQLVIFYCCLLIDHEESTIPVSVVPPGTLVMTEPADGQVKGRGSTTVLPQQATAHNITQGRTGEETNFRNEVERTTTLPNSVYTMLQERAVRVPTGPVPVERDNQTSATEQSVTDNLPIYNKGVVVISKLDRVNPTVQRDVGQTPVSHSPNDVAEVEVLAKPQLVASQARETCREPYCLEYLNHEEKKIYWSCARGRQDLTCKCRFLDGSKRKRVALVSLPGSGNTWVRGLLQRATGICTGSIVCDKTLRAEGFCGEGIHSRGQLAVKIHDSTLHWNGVRYGKPVKSNRPFFDAAIFLIRDPYRAAVAEWNREISNKYSQGLTGSNHIKYVDNRSFFGNNQRWDTFTRRHLTRWKLMMKNYLIHPSSHPILPIWYDDLKIDAVKEVKKMLRFLEVPDIGVEEALKEDFSTFYRNHTSPFDPFTPSQRHYYNTVILEIAQASSRENGSKIKRFARL